MQFDGVSENDPQGRIFSKVVVEGAVRAITVWNIRNNVQLSNINTYIYFFEFRHLKKKNIEARQIFSIISNHKERGKAPFWKFFKFKI